MEHTGVVEMPVQLPDRCGTGAVNSYFNSSGNFDDTARRTFQSQVGIDPKVLQASWNGVVHAITVSQFQRLSNR